MHRAAGLESLQARDPVRRLSPGEPLPRRGAEAVGTVDRGDAQRSQTRGWFRPGALRASGGTPLNLSHRVGTADALADRSRGRARSLHRSESVPEPVQRESHDRLALIHVYVRVEARPENDLLPAIA